MKKLLFAMMCCSAIIAYSRPLPRPRVIKHPPAVHHAYAPRHHIHHRHWVAPTIIGSALLGSAVLNAIAAPKTVIVEQPVMTQPIVVKQPIQVWIPGRYIDQLQPNGTWLRIWQPGHYELRYE